MIPNVEKVVKTDSVDEANKLLENGWILLQHDSAVMDGIPKYFFLLGKKSKTSLEKLVENLETEHQE